MKLKKALFSFVAICLIFSFCAVLDTSASENVFTEINKSTAELETSALGTTETGRDVEEVVGLIINAILGILGIIFNLFGLLYIPVLKPKNPLTRAVYNVLFVVGFSLLLAVVDNAGSLSLDLVTVGLCVFWMYSRIQFSQWNHNKTCRECNEKCEYYI